MRTSLSICALIQKQNYCKSRQFCSRASKNVYQLIWVTISKESASNKMCLFLLYGQINPNSVTPSWLVALTELLTNFQVTRDLSLTLYSTLGYFWTPRGISLQMIHVITTPYLIFFLIMLWSPKVPHRTVYGIFSKVLNRVNLWRYEDGKI